MSRVTNRIVFAVAVNPMAVSILLRQPLNLVGGTPHLESDRGVAEDDRAELERPLPPPRPDLVVHLPPRDRDARVELIGLPAQVLRLDVQLHHVPKRPLL